MYVLAKAEGVACIEKGRLFLVQPTIWGEGSLVPPEFPPGSITLEGWPTPTIRIAGPSMPVRCPACTEPLSATLLGHDNSWMNVLYHCNRHPVVVWLDISPKADGPSTQWDQLNCLSPAGHFNPGQQQTYKAKVSALPIWFILTPNGLVDIVSDRSQGPPPKRFGNMIEDLVRQK